MNATAYRAYAAQRIAEARRTLDAHTVEAYTGVCRGCGRPGPCDARRAARSRLAHHAGTLDDLRDGGPAAATRPAGAGWRDAVTECWRALALLHAGLASARSSWTSSPPPSPWSTATAAQRNRRTSSRLAQ